MPLPHDRIKKEYIKPEVKKVQKLIMPKWNSSLFNFESANTTEVSNKLKFLTLYLLCSRISMSLRINFCK